MGFEYVDYEVDFFIRSPIQMKCFQVSTKGGYLLPLLDVRVLAFLTAVKVKKKQISRSNGDQTPIRSRTFAMCFPIVFFSHGSKEGGGNIKD